MTVSAVRPRPAREPEGAGRLAARAVDVVKTHGAGDLRATRMAGQVHVVTRTGAVVGSDLNVTTFDARTSRDEITAAFIRPPDRIIVRIDAGSVRLTVPSATYAVDATTPPRAGRVTVDVAEDPAAPRRISAHASRGDIQILSW
jgi:hypothetical protein